jgi:SAM-dependent methyltransferase
MTNIFQKISKFYKDTFHAERFEIMKFIKFASTQIKPSDVVLDAGSGNKQPYKQQSSHIRHKSTDIEQSPNNAHMFLCLLDNIPKSDNTYDAIVCTQVLEHVQFPQKVIHEFYRVLKQDGKLFLTSPQRSEVYDAPYHFFNFTEYGLGSMFKQAGFNINFIRPNGGYFWNLAKRLRTLLNRYMRCF